LHSLSDHNNVARYGRPTESPLPAEFESEAEIQEADEELVVHIKDLTKAQGKPRSSANYIPH
jgi:hypothetical protein